MSAPSPTPAQIDPALPTSSADSVHYATAAPPSSPFGRPATLRTVRRLLRPDEVAAIGSAFHPDGVRPIVVTRQMDPDLGDKGVAETEFLSLTQEEADQLRAKKRGTHWMTPEERAKDAQDFERREQAEKERKEKLEQAAKDREESRDFRDSQVVEALLAMANGIKAQGDTLAALAQAQERNAQTLAALLSRDAAPGKEPRKSKGESESPGG